CGSATSRRPRGRVWFVFTVWLFGQHARFAVVLLRVSPNPWSPSTLTRALFREDLPRRPHLGVQAHGGASCAPPQKAPPACERCAGGCVGTARWRAARLVLRRAAARETARAASARAADLRA